MPLDELRFDDRVVIVTGDGGGLGREYALAFSERGASVVVNDLGSSRGSDVSTNNFADEVVQEIRSKGGKAVANYDSVEDGEKVVQTALDHFGRVDILINNAGIVRDKIFDSMTIQEWDIIHRVNLRGSFLVTKAVWEHMKKQKFGRIIMTSSASGLYGNYGQANYSAAKLGLVGLANTLALEGKKHNIHINTISPVAGTRLTKDFFSPELFQALKPEYVVPIVMWLCHEQCQECGGVFEAGGGYMTKIRWQRSEGAALRERGKKMLPEHVRDNWRKVTDFSEADPVEKVHESLMRTGEQLARIESGDNDVYSYHQIQPRLIKNYKFPLAHVQYGSLEVILYALGIGASTRQPDDLKFIYEGSEDFCVLPTFAILPSIQSLNSLADVVVVDVAPGKILHGEHYMEIYKPIPTEGKLTSQNRVVEILDKGSGAAVITNVDTFDESGDKIFFNQSVLFYVGLGNFGGVSSSTELKESVKPPNRAPDDSVTEEINQDQAAIYRLSGDRNPLHIDPVFSAMGGFKQPLLHGLCSFGYATRHVMKKYADGDPAKIRAVKTRFAKPVFPGQTLRTDMWQEGLRVFFRTTVEETGAACLIGGYVDLVDDSKASTGAVALEQEIKFSRKVLESDALFEGLKNLITPDIVKKIDAVFEWTITKDGKVARKWALDLKNGLGSVTRGSADKPDCKITISDSNATDMFTGKLKPRQAFVEGRFKLTGNIMMGLRLGPLFKAQANL